MSEQEGTATGFRTKRHAGHFTWADVAGKITIQDDGQRARSTYFARKRDSATRHIESETGCQKKTWNTRAGLPDERRTDVGPDARGRALRTTERSIKVKGRTALFSSQTRPGVDEAAKAARVLLPTVVGLALAFYWSEPSWTGHDADDACAEPSWCFLANHNPLRMLIIEASAESISCSDLFTTKLYRTGGTWYDCDATNRVVFYKGPMLFRLWMAPVATFWQDQFRPAIAEKKTLKQKVLFAEERIRNVAFGHPSIACISWRLHFSVKIFNFYLKWITLGSDVLYSMNFISVWKYILIWNKIEIEQILPKY